MRKTILVAGATGNLGGKIVDALISNEADVRAIVRAESDRKKVGVLRDKGVRIFQAEMSDKSAVVEACENVGCVVSALSGLREVIVDAQQMLVDGAVAAGVPRFIPSVYSLDFTNLIPGKNRNLDLRREFNGYLENAPIRSTSIFNGAFMDLLTTDMPLILYRFKRILYWGDPAVKMDLTYTADVAEYTARAALDADAPKILKIAGDSVSASDVKEIVSDITERNFRLFRPGSIGLLNVIIKIARFFSRDKTALYPAWQGMQYMRDMMEGRAVLDSHDNDRYSDMKWTSVEEFLTAQNVKKYL